MLFYIICIIFIIGIMAQRRTSSSESVSKNGHDVKNTGKKKESWRYDLPAIVASICFGIFGNYCYDILKATDTYEAESFLKNAVQMFIYMSPYGRNAAKEDVFSQLLAVGTILVVVYLGLMMYQIFFILKKKYISYLICAITIFFAVWYFSYGICYLTYTILNWNIYVVAVIVFASTFLAIISTFEFIGITDDEPNVKNKKTKCKRLTSESAREAIEEAKVRLEREKRDRVINETMQEIMKEIEQKNRGK